MNSTHTTRRVLTALLANGGEMTGYDIVKATGLNSGTVYPIVRRLAANELVTARESLERSRLRIHYRLTDKGRAAAQEATASAAPEDTPKP